MIERVCTFKYLGTFFSEDLKWHKNSEEIFKNIKSRFNAFSKFKSFNPSATQCNHFIQSLILPVFYIMQSYGFIHVLMVRGQCF